MLHVIEHYIEHYIVVIIFGLLGCVKFVAFLPSKIDNMFYLKSVILVL